MFLLLGISFGVVVAGTYRYVSSLLAQLPDSNAGLVIDMTETRRTHHA